MDAGLFAVAYILLVLAPQRGWIMPRTGPWLTVLLAIVAYGLFLIKDSFGGESPGKRVFGLMVVDRSTLEPCSVLRSIQRNLMFVFLSWIGMLLAWGSMEDGPRIGERWARTKVIWKPKRDRLPFWSETGTLCPQCGYELTGNVSGVCPECGTEVGAKLQAWLAAHPPQGHEMAAASTGDFDGAHA